MSTPAPQGAGGYRVGDAERGRTVDLLKEAHAAGYLTLDEVDERLTLALTARSDRDLARLAADLPPDWRARHEVAPRPQQPAPRRPAPPPMVWALVPLLLAAVVMLVIGFATRGFFFPWPLLWLWFFLGRRWTRASWHHTYRL